MEPWKAVKGDSLALFKGTLYSPTVVYSRKSEAEAVEALKEPESFVIFINKYIIASFGEKDPFPGFFFWEFRPPSK